MLKHFHAGDHVEAARLLGGQVLGGLHAVIDCGAAFQRMQARDLDQFRGQVDGGDVGEVDDDSRRLVQVTRECLDRGIAAVRPGRPLSAIGRAIEDHATKAGYSVIRTFVGHGIGEQFHGEPSVLHYYEPRYTTPMEVGMVFTIEPMIAMGDHREVIWPDGWTAVTVDGLRTAQFEHTLVVTESGAEVLTR